MTNTSTQPTGTLPERVVDYVGYASAAMEKMASALEVTESQRTKCAALIPQVVDALVSGERITEAQREKAAALLQDPVEALKLLMKTAIHRNAGERSLGQPADGTLKTASSGRAYDSLQSPHVGARTSRVKQSDARLFQGLGLSIPNDV